MARLVFLMVLLLPLLPAAIIQQYAFDTPPVGWVIANRSDGPPDDSRFSDGWVHSSEIESALPIDGNDSPTDPFMYTSVFASNLGFESAASTWLVTPVIDLRVARFVSFYTIGVTPESGVFPDAMQVLFRQGTSAATLNVGDGGIGATANSEGLYTQLLLDINPGYLETGYPQTWTQYTLALPSASETSGDFGRVAFRYYITDASSFGNAIALDDVSISGVPEPTTFLLIGAPLIAFAIFRRRNTPTTP